MSKANPIMIALMICTMSMGLWGCTQQKTGAFSTKIREMEARYTKLEEDYRAIVVASEQGRKKVAVAEAKLSELEAQHADLSKEVESLRPIVAERDDLRRQLQTRTNERDAVQSQFLQFSRDLQSLAGRFEAAASALQSPSVAIVPVSRTSAE